MQHSTMVEITDSLLISAVVERGMADMVVDAAMSAGAHGATVYYARGCGTRERMGVWGITVNVEKEIIEIIVAQSASRTVSEAIYRAADLSTPGKGALTIRKLEGFYTYVSKAMLTNNTNDGK